MTVSVHIYVQCVSSPSPPCLSMVACSSVSASISSFIEISQMAFSHPCCVQKKGRLETDASHFDN